MRIATEAAMDMHRRHHVVGRLSRKGMLNSKISLFSLRTSILKNSNGSWWFGSVFQGGVSEVVRALGVRFGKVPRKVPGTGRG